MRLFITYARDDVARVSELARILAAGGHAVWFDSQLLPGQDWAKALGDEIERCDALVYALTKQAAASEWCEWELATAVRLRKAIVPVLLEDDVAIPAALRTLQFADFRLGPAAIETAKLIGALGSMQKVPANRAREVEVPANPQGIPSRAWESVTHWTDYITTAQHQPRNDAEEIQDKYTASYFPGVFGISGRLIITTQRVLFEAHRVNLKRQNVEIFLHDITAVFPSYTLGLVPNAFTVRCRSGKEYKFNVFGRDEVIALIDRLRASTSPPSS